MTDARRDLLAEVAWLHHGYHRTQEEIATRLGVSRSTISRALAEAERLGIIQVVVTAPLPREARLSADLARSLGITAIVGVAADGDEPFTAAARAAARLVDRIVDAGPATIAVSWGRTLAATARMVRPRTTRDVEILDAVGHPGGEGLVPTVDVTRSLAAALGAAVTHVPAPAFVDPGPSRDALLASEPVARALARARRADVTLVSVGVVGAGSLLAAAGGIDARRMAELQTRGAVGEILGHYFDQGGQDVEGAGTGSIGLTLDDLRASRRVIAVAGGPEKADALRAALAGGIVREAVIDDTMAATLLQAAPVPVGTAEGVPR
ncbi:MAG TPA: sugar-binding domain-containing protein [Candidatus Limnocylindrales bacterium]